MVNAERIGGVTMRMLSAPRGWLCGLLLGGLPAAPAAAHNGAVARACPVSGIVVDGDVSDWPDAAQVYPIQRLEYGEPLRGEADLRAGFRVGYDAAEDAIYVAVEVEDDSAVRAPDTGVDWDTQDGCEAYLNLAHDAGDGMASQYDAWRGMPGPRPVVYGYDTSADVGKHIVETASGYRSEWRIGLNRPLRPHPVPGDVVGFDVAVVDRDADGYVSWVAWGPGTGKLSGAARVGDLLLQGSPAQADSLRLVARSGMRRAAGAGQQVRVGPGQTVRLPDRRGDPAGEGFSLEVLTGRLVNDVLARADGSAWFATDHGLTRLRGDSLTTWTRDDGLPEDHVTVLAEGNGSALWLGTRESGLVRWEGHSATWWRLVDGLADDRVRCLLADGQGGVWVGTLAGLSHFGGTESVTFWPWSGRVTSLLRDAQGRVWIGTDRGLRRNDGTPADTLATMDELAGRYITCLLRDASSRLWIGTYSGLYAYDAPGAGQLRAVAGGRLHVRGRERGPGPQLLGARPCRGERLQTPGHHGAGGWADADHARAGGCRRIRVQGTSGAPPGARGPGTRDGGGAAHGPRHAGRPDAG
ncbi:MAG: two-component regulator propeller domain-containing protein [Candidatus Latescibacterota bacterium]